MKRKDDDFMEHHLQAYFKNENDAEAAHVKLKKLQISNDRIDSIPENDSSVLLIPAVNRPCPGPLNLKKGAGMESEFQTR